MAHKSDVTIKFNSATMKYEACLDGETKVISRMADREKIAKKMAMCGYNVFFENDIESVHIRSKLDTSNMISEDEAIAMVTKFVNKYSLEVKGVLVVDFFRGSNVAGMAYRNESRVSFNLDYACAKAEQFEKTVAHEVAHIIQFQQFPNAKQAHGPEFRRIMKKFGFAGDTFHTYGAVKRNKVKRMKLTCPHCAKDFFFTPKAYDDMKNDVNIGKMRIRCPDDMTVLDVNTAKLVVIQ